jgi:hypothetical protein
MVELYFQSPITSHGLVLNLLIKHKDNFAFALPLSVSKLYSFDTMINECGGGGMTSDCGKPKCLEKICSSATLPAKIPRDLT